jgi:hypothetical protein
MYQFLAVAPSTPPSPRSFRNTKTEIRVNNLIETKRGLFNTISINIRIIGKGFIANKAENVGLT